MPWAISSVPSPFGAAELCSELPKGQDEQSSGTGGAAGSLQRKVRRGETPPLALGAALCLRAVEDRAVLAEVVESGSGRNRDTGMPGQQGVGGPRRV